MTFGFGIHFCLGAPLARIEGQICINALLRRYRTIEFAAEPSSFEWLDALIMRGVKALPLRLGRA